MSTIAVETGTSPRLVQVPRRTCLVADGPGGPHSADFRHAMEAVYAVAMTLKLQMAIEGRSFELEPPGLGLRLGGLRSDAGRGGLDVEDRLSPAA